MFLWFWSGKYNNGLIMTVLLIMEWLCILQPLDNIIPWSFCRYFPTESIIKIRSSYPFMYTNPLPTFLFCFPLTFFNLPWLHSGSYKDLHSTVSSEVRSKSILMAFMHGIISGLPKIIHPQSTCSSAQFAIQQSIPKSSVKHLFMTEFREQ